LAEDLWTWSPWKNGAERAAATDRAICCLPAAVVLPMMRTMYLDGLGRGEEGLEGRRWSSTWGVAGRGGSGEDAMMFAMLLL
jgi:hypothetical protein